jgi:hypothetical protein
MIRKLGGISVLEALVNSSNERISLQVTGSSMFPWSAFNIGAHHQAKRALHNIGVTA